jgi:dTDP-glucose 4,6-dehydratase
MRILVTGGAGFIGSNLVNTLLQGSALQQGSSVERVVTLDKLTYAGNPRALAVAQEDPRHYFVQGDVCDRALVADLLREHRVNAVMHLASESHVDRSIANPEDFVMTNYVGSYRMLEAFRHHLAATGGLHSSAAIANGGPAMFLHVSTDEVFCALGPNDPPFDESSPSAPNSPYSASKAGSDLMVRAYHHTYGLPVVTTRCSNNYGPWQHSEKLIPHMIRRALRGETLPVYGDGTQVRDWIHVSDHCHALCRALVHGMPGASYVIGGRCEIRNIDLVRHLLAIIRELVPGNGVPSADDLITFVADRPGHDFRYALDPSRIMHDLAWKPSVDFHAGLRETVRWYLDHPEELEIRL